VRRQSDRFARFKAGNCNFKSGHSEFDCDSLVLYSFLYIIWFVCLSTQAQVASCLTWILWGAAMPTAEQVATFLAYEFLKEGRYSASVGPIEVPTLAEVVAAASEDEEVVMAYAQRAEPFGGLAVQAVGFEDGVRDAKVHIYLTRGLRV
jgi:hypothetical protein